MSNDAFKKDFARLMEHAGEKAGLVVQAAAAELLKRVVQKSPVGDPSGWDDPESAPPGYVGGRFKNNWQVSIGAINGSTGAPPDKTGSGSLQVGQAVIAQYVLGQTIYITNSLPYAKRLEYDAWSKQAPAGMVRTSVAEYKQIVKQAVVAIKD